MIILNFTKPIRYSKLRKSLDKAIGCIQESHIAELDIFPQTNKTNRYSQKPYQQRES